MSSCTNRIAATSVSLILFFSKYFFNRFHGKHAFKARQIIAIKNEWLSLENTLAQLFNILLEM